jgi:hypothetical protein
MVGLIVVVQNIVSSLVNTLFSISTKAASMCWAPASRAASSRKRKTARYPPQLTISSSLPATSQAAHAGHSEVAAIKIVENLGRAHSWPLSASFLNRGSRSGDSRDGWTGNLLFPVHCNSPKEGIRSTILLQDMKAGFYSWSFICTNISLTSISLNCFSRVHDVG